jgi:uncharacterized protein with FMN-binding domain
MRRAVLTLGGTIAGLAVLLSFKSHSATPNATAAAGPPSNAPGTTSPAQPGGTSGTTGAGAARPTPSTARQPGRGSPAATRTITGAVASTQYGPMQIQLTLTGQRITKVTILQRTNDGTESNQIDAFAIPKLTSETLTAQSSRIDAVSGATYTSAGYTKSLQSALDQARS